MLYLCLGWSSRMPGHVKTGGKQEPDPGKIILAKSPFLQLSLLRWSLLKVSFCYIIFWVEVEPNDFNPNLILIFHAYICLIPV